MDDFRRRRHHHHRRELHLSRRRSWCCSFAVPPSSPDTVATKPNFNSDSKLGTGSVPSSPQSSKSGLSLPGRIHPRRILSPGRVSPIEQHPTTTATTTDPSLTVDSKTYVSRAPEAWGRGSVSGSDNGEFDVRLNLRGKSGNGLVLELSSEVLCANSEVFKALINGSKKNELGERLRKRRLCTVEIAELENLGVFRETVELMFEDDCRIVKRLMRIGVYGAISVLEISASIMFARGVSSCLKYLEAVPWTVEEEEKLRSLLTKFKLENQSTTDILARLYAVDSVNSQEKLAKQLVSSVTSCADVNTRNELKSLVKGILCKSSVYDKGSSDIKKEDIYAVCQSCLNSLVILFQEASESGPSCKVEKEMNKPLIERISRQVDNINWLLEILIDRQVAEELVDIWANQRKLLKLHQIASPMVRYELSRVSANLLIAIGNRKLHCYSEPRSALLQAWFGPMLLDFGWLQRCRKGLDMRTLEEALGQTLLTLSLQQQHLLFMEWFRCFSTHGNECPNLSKAFQIWWRRTSDRGAQTYAVESR